MSAPSIARPTHIRFAILALATSVALLLYLDRYCLSTSDLEIKKELTLTDDQMAWIRSAFFFTYALGQIPMGWLSDRLGVRNTLSLYMVLWSAFTGLIGAIRGFTDFVVYRLGCGLFEAGAYPACAGMIRRWSSDQTKGLWSAVVSFGGRFGGTVTPLIVPFFVALLGWRAVMWGLGLFGIGLGIFFYFFYRNRPSEHPWCNRAEAEMIEGSQLASKAGKEGGSISVPWKRVFTNLSLWMSSFVQFGINFGWVFILTDFNQYLADVRGATAEQRPWMVFTVMIFNLPALLIGGRLTDYLTMRYGKRLGRALPMGIPRLLSGLCYFMIPISLMIASSSGHVLDTWTIVLLMGLMAFFSDLCLPAIWGFNLDVGKRHVGLVLGWGNMWGNLGGALTPLAVNYVKTAFGWPAVFWMFGGCFVLIGLISLFINADNALEKEGN